MPRTGSHSLAQLEYSRKTKLGTAGIGRNITIRISGTGGIGRKTTLAPPAQLAGIGKNKTLCLPGTSGIGRNIMIHIPAQVVTA